MDALRNIVAQQSAGPGDLAGLDLPDLASLKKQAGALWKFLDDLAEDDPLAYQSFLKQQAQAAQAAQTESKQKQPINRNSAPAYIIHAQPAASTLSKPAAVVSVHIWSDDHEGLKVSLPHTVNSDTLATLVIPLHEHNHASSPSALQQQQPNQHYHIACHSATIQAALGNPQLQQLLVEAAYQFVEQKHNIKLNRSAREIKVNSQLLSSEQRARLLAQQQQGTLQAAVAGTAAEQLPSSLLNKLSDLGIQHKESPSNPTTSSAKARLIQELDEVPAASSSTTKLSSTHSDGKPEIQVQCLKTANGQATIMITANIKQASSAKDVDVEVTGGTVVLSCRGQSWTVALPEAVQEGSGTAKFDKHSKVLTLQFQAA